MFNVFFKPKKLSLIRNSYIKENGFSIIDLSIVITIIGILAVMIIPNFSPALEFVEILIAEKHLFKSVKECQIGLLKNDLSPQYNLPTNDSGMGILNKNKFSFSYTGNLGECINTYNKTGNRIRLTRSNSGQISNYSLIINVVTGEKTSEGKLPEWLDWWEDINSPIIPENDPLLREYQ